MFSLFYGFYKYLTKKDEYFVLILGLDNAGKTTYLEQAKIKYSQNLNKSNLHRVTTTVGMNIGSIIIGPSKLNFWDLGGQEELQSLWDKYYSEAHAIIYVIDSSDTQRLTESKNAFKKIIQNHLINNLPIMILLNKQDLKDCLSLIQIRNEFNSLTSNLLINQHKFFSISAINGEGIKESINWLMDQMIKNIDLKPPLNSQ
ncbi:ADP-ribosylation factor-related protein 1-like isoform X1 [Gordionus sp. m RMFG-2023]|uniref:ADP-ribosylation factor-related protein 1-like isoform X1 n=1 Tax=Gordionus sp. m RMFG-2023 TaxID=3053472 RepID=UPI0031FC6008